MRRVFYRPQNAACFRSQVRSSETRRRCRPNKDRILLLCRHEQTNRDARIVLRSVPFALLDQDSGRAATTRTLACRSNLGRGPIEPIGGPRRCTTGGLVLCVANACTQRRSSSLLLRAGVGVEVSRTPSPSATVGHGPPRQVRAPSAKSCLN